MVLKYVQGAEIKYQHRVHITLVLVHVTDMQNSPLDLVYYLLSPVAAALIHETWAVAT